MKRRFIAGATCPVCQAQDRIVMISSQEDEWIECIECNYSDRRPTEVTPQEPSQADAIGVIQFRPHKK
jgi:uncharacterized metal-binding protein (TIGR02443 family)